MKRQNITLTLDEGGIKMLTEFRRLKWKKSDRMTLASIAYAVLYVAMLDLPRIDDALDKVVKYCDAEGLDRDVALKEMVASKVRPFRKYAQEQKKFYNH